LSALPQSVQKVIEEFEKLPGVGPKSAARMAYHFLRSPNKDASFLAKNLMEMDEKVHFCKGCFNVCEGEECDICGSFIRDRSKICVVEEPLDVVAFENSGVFNGLYFVLGGVISPADGIGAEDIRFPDLVRRVNELMLELEKHNSGSDKANKAKKSDDVSAKHDNATLQESIDSVKEQINQLEIIVATNPSLEGEATYAYILDLFDKLIEDGKVVVTRLAMGLPTGADLEYADRVTLKRALEGRR